MTIGTAMVARTNVRRTGPTSVSQGPSVRLRTVRVGKTAIQIIRASWCLVGGPTGVGPVGWAGWGVRVVDMVVLLRVWRGWLERRERRWPDRWRSDGCRGAGRAGSGDGDRDVLLDEVGVDGDGGGGALAGGGDDLGARVDGVAGGPDAGHAGAPGGVDGDPAVVVGRAAQGGEQAVVGDEPGPDEHRGRGGRPGRSRARRRSGGRPRRRAGRRGRRRRRWRGRRAARAGRR